jgi:hypothetical protein
MNAENNPAGITVIPNGALQKLATSTFSPLANVKVDCSDEEETTDDKSLFGPSV